MLDYSEARPDKLIFKQNDLVVLTEISICVQLKQHPCDELANINVLAVDRYFPKTFDTYHLIWGCLHHNFN
jgi:hypothetical protein